MLDDVSTDGRYLGRLLAIGTLPLTNVSFLFLPRTLKFYSLVERRPARIRGARTGGVVFVSGIAPPDGYIVSSITNTSHLEPKND